MHPVDKVHVGDPGRPVHDGVPGGPSEACVGRAIVLADVGLELDDPGHPPGAIAVAVARIVPDQPAAEQRPAELESRQREDVSNGGRYRVLTGT